jgi:hypothetical protein
MVGVFFISFCSYVRLLMDCFSLYLARLSHQVSLLYLSTMSLHYSFKDVQECNLSVTVNSKYLPSTIKMHIKREYFVKKMKDYKPRKNQVHYDFCKD